jgi:hypothetical protein
MVEYNMNIEEANNYKKQLDDLVDLYSKQLNEFEKGIMGLTPVHVRNTPEWKEANVNYNKAFKELRNFNQWYVKTFMKKRKRSKKAAV